MGNLRTNMVQDSSPEELRGSLGNPGKRNNQPTYVTYSLLSNSEGHGHTAYSFIFLVRPANKMSSCPGYVEGLLKFETNKSSTAFKGTVAFVDPHVNGSGLS